MSKNTVDLDPTHVSVNYWTVEIACRHMNISRTRMRALMREGRLQTYRLDRRTVLLSRAEVEGFQKRPGGRPKISVTQAEDIIVWKRYGTIFPWMLTAHPSQVAGECRVCGRRVGTVIPKDGNGVVRVAIKHKPPEPAIRMKLPGGAVILPQCNGTRLPPKGWPTGKTDYTTGLDIQPEDPRYRGEVPEMRWRPGLKG
jgi:excisionase family DNA binding protein